MRCLLIALMMVLCAGSAHSAEVTLSIEKVTWQPGQTEKLVFHVTHPPPFAPYPHDYMYGWNFAVHVPVGLVFTPSESSVFEPWYFHIACGTCPPGGNISVVGWIYDAAANQTASGALAFRNVTGQALTPCNAPITFWDFQAGAALGGFTTEIAPYPCASPPSDVLDDRPADSTWSVVKELYR